MKKQRRRLLPKESDIKRGLVVNNMLSKFGKSSSFMFTVFKQKDKTPEKEKVDSNSSGGSSMAEDTRQSLGDFKSIDRYLRDHQSCSMETIPTAQKPTVGFGTKLRQKGRKILPVQPTCCTYSPKIDLIKPRVLSMGCYGIPLK